jgi:MFS family permease
MKIRADQVRFSGRDSGRAVGGAAGLGALFGALTLVIPAAVSTLSGTEQASELLPLYLLFAVPIGAAIGLGGAAGAAIAYVVARRGRTTRVGTFTVLMAIGAGLGAAFGVLVFLVLGDNGDHYYWEHLGLYVPLAGFLFAGGAIPVGVIVPLAFRSRALRPLPVGAESDPPVPESGRYPIGPQ